MWRRVMRKDRAAVEESLAEATQLVTGEVADRYLLGDRLPPWVIINTLAHSDQRRLKEVAADQSTHPGSWRAIISYLAVELLSNSSDRGDLERIQRHVLIPLELRLLAGQTRQPKTPAQLAALVTEGISDLRSGR